MKEKKERKPSKLSKEKRVRQGQQAKRDRDLNVETHPNEDYFTPEENERME